MGRHGVRGQKQASKQRGGLPRHTDGRETGRETEGRPTGQLSKTREKPGSLEARSLSGPSWSDTWTPDDSGQADRTSRQQTAARRNNPSSGNPDAASDGALSSSTGPCLSHEGRSSRLGVWAHIGRDAACLPTARINRALSLPDRGGGPGTAEQCGEVTARAIACACASVDDDDASLWRSTRDTAQEAGPEMRC